MCMALRVKHSVRRLKSILLGACIGLLGASMAYGQTPGAVINATSITGASATSGGLSGTLNAVITATEARGYYSAPVTVSWANLGAAARAGLRGVTRYGPYVGLALTAAELAGWVREGDWFTHGDGQEAEPLPSGGQWLYCTEGSAGLRCVSSAGAACGLASRHPIPGKTVGSCSVTGNPPFALVEWLNPDGSVFTYGGIMRQWFDDGSTAPNGNESTPATPVTDEDMAKRIAEMGSGPRHNMLHDSSGRPHQFPEVRVALENMAASAAAQSGIAVAAGGEPAPAPAEEPEGQPEPEPGTEATPSDLPAFCEWAKVVCDFIDWVKEDEELEDVEMPIQDEEIEVVDWSSGYEGGGSCPAPETVSVMGETIEFSYDPICQFATAINPAIQFIALCMAAFIIAGLRNGNA